MNRHKRSFANSVVYVSMVAMIVVSLFMVPAFAQNPVPQIVGPVKPSAVAPGSGAFTLTVYGANFVPGSVVEWNGQVRSTTFISARELQAQILSADVATNTAGLISVVNPGPGGGSSSSSWAQVEVHTPVTAFAFRKGGTYLAGGWDTMVADFNHDGILDYVGQAGGALDLYDGKGDGTFHFESIAGRFYSGGPQGTYGDFNGDGNLDVAFAQGYGKNASTIMTLMLGDGKGHFNVGSRTNDSLGLGVMAAADFNGDGKLDLVIGGGQGMLVLLGNGDGTFQRSARYLYMSDGVVAADFDGDGKLDIAIFQFSTTANNWVSVSILMGNGDGTFQPPQVITTVNGTQPCGFQEGPLRISDFNGDGHPDLSFCTDSQIGVLLGNGDGTFQSPIFATAGVNRLFTYTVADINSDGYPDLLVSQYDQTNNPQFVAFLGDGTGSFQPQTITLPSVAGTELGLMTGDFNSDGLVDIGFPDNGLEIFVQ